MITHLAGPTFSPTPAPPREGQHACPSCPHPHNLPCVACGEEGHRDVATGLCRPCWRGWRWSGEPGEPAMAFRMAAARIGWDDWPRGSPPGHDLRIAEQAAFEILLQWGHLPCLSSDRPTLVRCLRPSCTASLDVFGGFLDYEAAKAAIANLGRCPGATT